MNSATSEGDLVKGLEVCDVIERSDVAECEESESGTTADDIIDKQSDAGDNVTMEENNVTKEAVENNVTDSQEDDDDDDVTVDTTVADVTDIDVVTTEEKLGENEACENQLPGLVEELSPQDCATESRSEVTIEVCDVTIDVCDAEQETSFEDPVEILLNFFYTSHIDITAQNVTMLRAVSQQCGMTDVTMACDTFSEMSRTGESGAEFRHRYSDPQMPLKMLEHFQKLRANSRHDDVTVTSRDAPFRAHKAILAAASSYFRDVITDDEKQIEMTNSVLLSYLYSGIVSVSGDSVKSLIDHAETLGLRDVTEGCAEFMEGSLSANNAVDYHRVADKYRCQKLKVSRTFKDLISEISDSSLHFRCCVIRHLVGVKANQTTSKSCMYAYIKQ